MSFSSSCRKKNCGIIHSLANAKQKTLERRTPELKRHMLRYLRSRISVDIDLWDQEIDEELWCLLCVCRNGERRDRERGMRRTGHYLHRWCYSPPFYLSKPLLYLHRSNPVGPNVLSVRVHKMSLTLSLRSSIYHSISSLLTIRGSKSIDSLLEIVRKRLIIQKDPRISKLPIEGILQLLHTRNDLGPFIVPCKDDKGRVGSSGYVRLARQWIIDQRLRFLQRDFFIIGPRQLSTAYSVERSCSTVAFIWIR